MKPFSGIGAAAIVTAVFGVILGACGGEDGNDGTVMDSQELGGPNAQCTISGALSGTSPCTVTAAGSSSQYILVVKGVIGSATVKATMILNPPPEAGKTYTFESSSVNPRSIATVTSDGKQWVASKALAKGSMSLTLTAIAHGNLTATLVPDPRIVPVPDNIVLSVIF